MTGLERISSAAPAFRLNRIVGPIMVLIGLLVEALAVPSLSVTAASLVFVAFVLTCDPRVGSHLMFLVGVSTFLFFPALLNTLVLGTGFELFYWSALVGFVFLDLTKDLVCVQTGDRVRYSPALFGALSVYMGLFSFVSGDLVRPVFATYLVLFAISMQGRSVKACLGLLGVFIAVVVVYMAFAWDGFGRSVVSAWLICGVLYFLYAARIGASRILFGLLPPAASLMLGSREPLAFAFSGWDVVLGDSAFGPYRLASEFFDGVANRGVDISGFLDQVVFVVFVFVPREIWPGKPVAFGAEYTRENLAQYLVDAGHSVAGTLIGDQVYYLGHLGVLTGCATMLVISALLRFLRRRPEFFGYGSLLLESSLPVLAWGGVTSFAARTALPVIIAIFLLPALGSLFGAGRASSPTRKRAGTRSRPVD